ncbi:type VI secretion protein [Burkholderia aenigmatica]|uniref:Type VI secretion protein n=2 Tax=Burkholderiaceae TaxID=119060 RepID=A0A6J5IT84_9BURK|nr:type VI secretion protein [Burkholderia aenigmatica]
MRAPGVAGSLPGPAPARCAVRFRHSPMDDLLSFYERELNLLRHQAKEFARRYPKIAARVQLASGADASSADPHVERLFESFALLGARVSRRIDDDYPEFTAALADALYPHFLRPFPSCSIACFEIDASRAAQMSASVVIPRGTELYSRPVKGAKIFFRTAYDVTLSPLRLTAARFHAVAQAPRALRLRPDASAQISFTFEIQSPHASIADLKLDVARLHVRGEPLFRAALHDALSIHALQAFVEPDEGGRWVALDRVPFSPVGFEPDESLIPPPVVGHPVHALLTEYFAYPEKFDFFDCDLRRAGRIGGRRFTLHLLLKDVGADSRIAHALAPLDAGHVLLGCTPVVNLFGADGKLGHRPDTASPDADMYPLVVDDQSAFAYEIHSVDTVTQVEATPQGERTVGYRPLHALYHGGQAPNAALYWRTQRDALVAKREPGREMTLGFVDRSLRPVAAPAALVLKLTCSNRDLPTELAPGTPEGELMLEGGTLARRIGLLHRPTPSRQFRGDRGAMWRLVSMLSANPVRLSGGAAPVRDALALHDMARLPATVRQIDSVVDVTHQAVTAWVSGQPFASVVRGLEIRVVVDEDGLAGTGVHAFAQVLDRLLGEFSAPNAFTQLVMVSGRSGAELFRCARRRGTAMLL